MIPIQIPWTQQPPPGTPIDVSNPLNKGLVAAYDFNDASGMHDLVENNHGPVSTGTPIVVQTPQGLAVHLNGARFSIPNAPDLQFINQSQTIIMGLTPQAAHNGPEFIEKQSGALNLWQMRTVSNAWTMFVKDDATIEEAISSTTWTNGNYYNIAGMVDYGALDDVSIWVDGVKEIAVANNTTGDFETDTPILVGGGGGGSVNAYYHYLRIYRAAKTAYEMELLNENPWRVYLPQTIWIPTVVATALLANGTPSLEQLIASGVALRSGAKITDVNTTESWADGNSGLPITGSGFL